MSFERDPLSLDNLIELFREHGGTPELYLYHHYARFTETLKEFCSTWPEGKRRRVLDIGAHWLHQSVLWRQAGFEVTAVDLPGTFEVESVRSIARQLDIPLLKCQSLEHPHELDQVADASIDVVLFTEIIEHITFNPVSFWRQVHRIMSPGGRIVVTTPNYYSWKGRAWNFLRFISGGGGGIGVSNVLGVHTYGHHWREYSKAEVLEYFKMLSPDFVTVKAIYMPSYALSKIWWKAGVQIVMDRLWFARPNIHVEVQLKGKESGIVVEPRW
ncbi:MAG TPA: methyltransferase domain-containing protein [Luteibacter sp.]|nr:methyltransferase domain-containing protein [Luteibacter sp.]